MQPILFGNEIRMSLRQANTLTFRSRYNFFLRSKRSGYNRGSGWLYRNLRIRFDRKWGWKHLLNRLRNVKGLAWRSDIRIQLPNNIGCINTFYFQLALYGIQDKSGAGEVFLGNEKWSTHQWCRRRAVDPNGRCVFAERWLSHFHAENEFSGHGEKSSAQKSPRRQQGQWWTRWRWKMTTRSSMRWSIEPARPCSRLWVLVVGMWIDGKSFF